MAFICDPTCTLLIVVVPVVSVIVGIALISLLLALRDRVRKMKVANRKQADVELAIPAKRLDQFSAAHPVENYRSFAH